MEKNPFLLSHPIKIVDAPIKGKSGRLNKPLIDPATGELIRDGDSIEFRKTKKVDPAQFTKIYVQSWAVMIGLSKSGSTLLATVNELLTKNEDMIYLDFNTAAENGFKKGSTSFFKALKELERNNILISSENHTNIRYVNPSFIFKGSRIDLITSYLKVEESK